MVHALQKSARLINSGGELVEVHDVLDPPRIEIHNAGRSKYVGQLLSSNDFEDQRLTEQALLQVIQSEELSCVQSSIFGYLFYADTFSDLNQWLADSWEDAYMLGETKQLIEKMVKREGEGAKIALCSVARILKLKPTQTD